MDLTLQAPGTVEDPSGGTRSRDHSCRRNQTAMEDASLEDRHGSHWRLSWKKTGETRNPQRILGKDMV